MVEHVAYDQFTGATLGSYRLDTLIERHPWGPVFKASARQGGTNYIIRFIDTPLASARSGPAADAHIVYLGRFQQEANRISALQHPHILPLLDYGNYRGIPYLVYPHMSLISLRARLAQKVPADPLAIGLLLDQIASALEQAHKYAVLHRNLSTNSIFVQSNKQMLVAEFGLLRMHELGQPTTPREVASIDRPGPYEGSTESCAPEQLLGNPVDTYTDIYSLGAVLYRLLTGRPPFSGKTREEIIRQHLHAAVPSLTTLRPELPARLDAVINKAMAKDPQQRYHTPDELTQAYYQCVAPGLANRPDRGTPSINSSPSTDPLPSKQPSATPFAPAVPSRNPNPKSIVASYGESLSGIVQETSMTAKREGVSRRRLIIWAATSAGGGIAAVGALLALRFLGGPTASPATGTGTATPTTTSNSGGSVPAQNANVLARTADIPTNSAKTFPIANQKNPGVIVHLSDNRFVAFDSTCTHESCEVAYTSGEQMLKCPCHDAVFDPAKDAAVVSGPAPAPLKPIKISVNADGTITTV